MELKQRIIRFISQCPGTNNQQQRALYDLDLITNAIQKLDGDIEDYTIEYEDRGMKYTFHGETVARWDWITIYIIKPSKFGGQSLQNYIDWLTILSAKESDWVHTCEAAAAGGGG